MMRYFEDLRIGEQTPLGSHTFGADEIIRFAARFDPQPFHIDEAAARESHFGGLIASGWHTTAIWMRLMVTHWQKIRDSVPLAPGERRPRIGPSPGVRELSWRRPVFAGDTVDFFTRVTEKVELKSRPQWGLVVSRNEGLNQSGETVMSFLGQVLLERRPDNRRG